MNSSAPSADRDSHLDEDRILDLMHNLLRGAERRRALDHLAACPRCETLLRERVAERERLRATWALRAERGGEVELERRTLPVVHDGGMSSLGRRWAAFVRSLGQPRYRVGAGLAVALALLVLVVVPRLGGPAGTDRLRWLPTSFNDARFRASAAGVSAEAFQEGLEAYGRHDVKRAIELLAGASVTGNLETIRNIYLGSALAWDGRYPEAAEVLGEVTGHPLPDPWGGEARWTLWVAYRKSGQIARADSLLSILADEPGEIGDRARREMGGPGAR